MDNEWDEGKVQALANVLMLLLNMKKGMCGPEKTRDLIWNEYEKYFIRHARTTMGVKDAG
jgi:hypothetical protein